MLLSDKFFQGLGPHALGERPLAVFFQAGQGIRSKQARLKLAHEAAILNLRATNRAMPAASAALRDSTPTVGIRICTALSRSRSLTPRPSLPTMMAHFLTNSTSPTSVVPFGMSAKRAILRCSAAARKSCGSSAATTGTRKMDPADARRHFGLYGLTVPLRNATPVAPNASAA